MGKEDTSDYAIFHNMNHLAEDICHFNGEARIIGESLHYKASQTPAIFEKNKNFINTPKLQ